MAWIIEPKPAPCSHTNRPKANDLTVGAIWECPACDKWFLGMPMDFTFPSNGPSIMEPNRWVELTDFEVQEIKDNGFKLKITVSQIVLQKRGATNGLR